MSTPASLCAQIVAPYPPAGSIGVASQSGNFVSTFLNLSRMTGVGISRAVSAGNAAAVTVADYLGWYANDDATTVGLAYVEGITDGRGLMDRLASAAAVKPLVLVKGGATEGGATRRGEPHRSARRERQDLRRRVPCGRDHAGGRRDRGVRDRRHLRHATAPEGPEHRRAHDRRRLGCRHR